MLVGYMRVSTDSDRQVLDLQRDALVAAGVDERHLFEDRVSGSRGNRTGLAKSDHNNGPQGTRHRLPLAHRADGHNDAAR
jgi:hypothetical protein